MLDNSSSIFQTTRDLILEGTPAPIQIDRLTGIFLATLGNPLPLIPCKWTNMRIITLTCSIAALCTSIFIFTMHRQPPITLLISSAITTGQHYYLPQRLSLHVSLELVLVLSTMMNHLQVLQDGKYKLSHTLYRWHQGEDANDTALVNLITAIALTTIGFCFVIATAKRAQTLVHGTTLARTMQPSQLKGVLKHGALTRLSQKKQGNAVIIDGLGRQFLDRIPQQSLNAIFHHHHTYYYDATSGLNLEFILQEAVVTFQAPIDVIAFIGHADAEMMVLGHYHFYNDESIIKRLRQTLKVDSQILILGCNTLTRTENHPEPFANQLAMALPDTYVTGIAADFTPLLSKTTYQNGFFKFDSYGVGTEDMNHQRGRSTLLNNSRTYRGSAEIPRNTSSAVFRTFEPLLIRLMHRLESLITVR